MIYVHYELSINYNEIKQLKTALNVENRDSNSHGKSDVHHTKFQNHKKVDVQVNR